MAGLDDILKALPIDDIASQLGVDPSEAKRAVEQGGATILSGLQRKTCAPIAKKANCQFECTTFDDLVVTVAKRAGATLLIRGLRDGTDFDYEMQMSGVNGHMAPGVRTVFLPASPPVRHITATLVRQISAMGGEVSGFVPAPVLARLKKKFAGRSGSK